MASVNVVRSAPVKAPIEVVVLSMSVKEATRLLAFIDFHAIPSMNHDGPVTAALRAGLEER